MALEFNAQAPEVAKKLIGYRLTVDDENGKRGGTINETEAYTPDDPASHSHIGKTSRNAAMFMRPGTIYIYKIYGIHYCLNFVCGFGDGQAVLIRSLEPTDGISFMMKKRKIKQLANLCNGPGKLVQALDLSPDTNTLHINQTNIELLPPKSSPHIKTAKRVGISKAVEVHWRFIKA